MRTQVQEKVTLFTEDGLSFFEIAELENVGNYFLRCSPDAK